MKCLSLEGCCLPLAPADGRQESTVFSTLQNKPRTSSVDLVSQCGNFPFAASLIHLQGHMLLHSTCPLRVMPVYFVPALESFSTLPFQLIPLLLQYNTDQPAQDEPHHT